MKKAEGEPISKLRENDNFPVIREKLLTALKDIHSKGVAHGDVHANNV